MCLCVCVCVYVYVCVSGQVCGSVSVCVWLLLRVCDAVYVCVFGAWGCRWSIAILVRPFACVAYCPTLNKYGPIGPSNHLRNKAKEFSAVKNKIFS